MNTHFQTIIREILSSCKEPDTLCSFNASAQFQKSAAGSIEKANSAFLTALAGPEHPLYKDAYEYLTENDDPFAGFLLNSLSLVTEEIDKRAAASNTFRDILNSAADYCTSTQGLQWNVNTQKALWPVFFPEGISCLQEPEHEIEALRQKRTIASLKPNEAPLKDPGNELLFTSNILLTVPSSIEKLDEADLTPALKDKVRKVMSQKQDFWFDHPIQIGVPTANNEAIYGLRGLNNACDFEKKHANMPANTQAVCILSVSVTHSGLHAIAREYLEAEFAKIEPLEHLRIFIFTEKETDLLIDKILAPAAKKLIPGADAGAIKRVFGVDGEYGRHYSFLKAITALWQALVDNNARATFKIDLDQVFPQEVLVETTGSSAFEHFMSPLWGATGTDSSGNDVELGMIAGALVNEKDISQGLYTPDVRFPENIPSDEGVFFMSGLPMALSTEAEMGTRYGRDNVDGEKNCIQRVHVTGGTNGILIRSLRKYRPFTPTFIGRAEDQAYLMSVMFSRTDSNLRYFHCDGLIMRHDKYAFAGEAIAAAKTGRQIGDLVRIVYFSNYARALPWPIEDTKDAFDPFTGCFISHIPVTIVMLRLCMSIGATVGTEEQQARELADVAIKRLGEAFSNMGLSDDYGAERAAWDLYYDILDAVESAGPEIENLHSLASQLIADCRIET